MSNETVISSLKEKIDDLNQQAWEARVNDSPKAFEISQESVKLARSINYSKGLAEGLRSLGFCYVRLFKNDEAAPLLKESLSLFQTLNDLTGQAVIYEYLGIIERNWGNLGHSLELLLKGNELVQQAGPIEVEVTSCYQIGVTYKHLGDHENALDYLYRSLSLAEKINLTLMVAYSTNIIGSIYFDNGNYKQALELYQQGLVIRRQSNDKWGEAGSLDNIGFTYLKLGQLDKAIDHCKQSLAICQSTGDKKGEANALLHLAEIYEQANDIRNASKFSNESLSIRKARGDKRGEAEVLLFLADLHKNNKAVEDQQVYEWISGALNIANEIKAQDLLSKSNFNLHEYYQQKGNYKESLIQLEAHLQIEKELHKNAINQKVSNLEISHKAEVISQRNKELTELNERIEKANAELKVEASLERVRAVSMSMSKPDDILSICKVMFTELQALGFKKIRNALINFWDDEDEVLHDYDYSDFSGGNFAKLSYSSHPVFEEFQKKVRHATDVFAELVISEGELETWKQRRRDSGEYEDPRLENISALYYYFYSTGVGALGISTFSPISKENLEVLKRFRNVFDLTYRRYLDIVKAEAQAREAQIQLALERVRARTMAMHHSDELTEVVKMLYQEFDKLKINNESTDIEIGLIDEETGIAKVWAHFYLSDGTISTFKFPFTHFEEINEEFKKWKATPVEKRNELFFTTEFSKKQWQRFMKIAEELPELAEIFRPLVEAKIEKWVTHNAYFSHGMLTLQGTEAYSKETQEIQKRFAKVFEQTYTRFLDLQKAEAQAREAQIEVAVERVRAKALAMHKSEEILGVVFTMRHELESLYIPGVAAATIMLRQDDGSVRLWDITSTEQYNESFRSSLDIIFKMEDTDPKLYLNRIWKSKEKYFVIEQDEEDFPTMLNWLQKYDTKAANDLKQVIKANNINHSWHPGVQLSHGRLNLDSDTAPEPEMETILSKMGAAFDLAYKRFLDLQKAEAQARESKIQLALERVRARTMAMQRSDELMETAAVLFNQLNQLGENIERTIIGLMNEEERVVDVWATRPDGSQMEKMQKFPIDEPIVMQKVYVAWRQQKKSIVIDLQGEELEGYFQFLKSRSYRLKRESFGERRVENFAFFSKGMLGVINADPKIPANVELYERFAAVFDQTYTRFLDLKNAEAQAREAQIQLALERVRARTMAMQKSDELPETSHILFEQMKELGEPVEQLSIGIVHEENNVIEISATLHGDTLKKIYLHSIDEPYMMTKVYKAWKTQQKTLIVELKGDELNSYNKYRNELTNSEMFPTNLGDEHRRIVYAAFFSKGMLALGANEPRPPQSLQLLERFASVFDLTYTRFLDLQKAEAQAREAQIEAALERVRSRTMAMHKSEELPGAATLLFHQLQILGMPAFAAGYCIWDEGKQAITLWMSSEGVLQPPFKAPTTEDELFIQMRKGFEEGKALHVVEMGGEELVAHYQYMRTLPVVGSIFDSILEAGHQLPVFQVMHYAYFSKGFLLIITYQPVPDAHTIFKRFAAVFDQTYIRFLDLQKAEAQAREAQIEAALEKVRSRSLAVHKSDEFNEVIKVVFERLQELEIPMTSVSINIAIDDSKDTDAYICGSGENGLALSHIRLIYFDHPIANDRYDAYKKGLDFFTKTYNAGEKNSFFEYQFEVSELKNIPPDIKKMVMNSKLYTSSVAFSKNSMIVVNDFEGKSLSPKEIDVVKRFSKVFEQAYIRFLDLKKAEAQAREAQIQLALERVRARTMAMQHSNELQDAAILLFEQIKTLGIPTGSCAFNIWNNDEASATVWSSSVEGKLQDPFQLSHTESPIYKDVYTAAKNGDIILLKEVGGVELKRHFDYLTTVPGIDHVINKLRESGYVFPEKIVYHFAFFNQGYLSFHLHEFYPEAKEIFVRFAKVFEQTYTRFLDLQKAEAQVREAQIETALERVRSRSMAMQKSDELKEVIQLVYEQFVQLKINVEHTGFIMDYKVRNDLHIWLADQHLVPSEVTIPWFNSPPNNSIKEAKEMGQDFFEYLLTFEEKNKFYRDLFKLIPDVPEETLEYYLTCPGLAGSGVLLENIGLYIENFSATPYTDEENKILMRFGKVFQQTYTRFNDLKQAEAQAREAQIELGLERVRARAMAMQKSGELKELIGTVSTELSKLDLVLDRCFIMTYDINTLGVTWWMANPETSSDPTGLYVKYHEQVPYLAFLKAWQERIVKWQYILEGSTKKTWDEFLFVETELSKLPRFVIDNMRANDKVYLSASFNNFGCLTLATLEPLTDDQFDIMLRFAKVFDLTYTRFNDLKQAEAQARDAQIEAALERVRAKVMAMNNSKDLDETSLVFGEQLRKLGINWQFSYFWLIEEEKNQNTFWITWPDNKTSITEYTLKEAEQYFNECLVAWKGGIKIHDNYVSPADTQAWLDTFQRITEDAGGVAKQIMTTQTFSNGVYYYDAMMKYGSFGMCINQPATDEEKNIQCRFAIEFERAYTRFLDLKKAEAQAREATIEVALERVRARALAMQQPEELKEVVQVLRNEMGWLGIEELETCSIYIHEKDSETAECWYALKDPKNEEKKMVADHFRLTLKDTWVGRAMKRFYNSDEKQTSIVMQGANRKEWIDYCYKNSPVFSGFYGEKIPDRTYHLYKFSHGYIGAAAPGDISNESWKLLNRAASVFSLAYSRFRDLTQARNDLIQLKEEKKRAEDALTELQATQKQLIQTEKMASLGELTAGIAHEIQNPLNFVNNFSDVSNELIEEMKDELATGNTKQAIEIANDVKDNLEKILHHGKRADAIVKGMLQHSRSSSGVKEPTDINNLADEYLRLAYHGYRAKDKSFSAKFETNFDESIEKINVIPQDMGRVILNLINNAFYTVNEKKKQVENVYEPIVTVATKKINDRIEISVRDNGNGIPQKMLDKIFQPFFTTKPTGQGTGLGLSLSYDIVTKGHDGEISVRTNEGKGTEFIISLPVN